MSIVLSVATAAEGYTSIGMLAPAIAFHAVSALAGVQLVGAAKRVKVRRLETAQA